MASVAKNKACWLTVFSTSFCRAAYRRCGVYLLIVLNLRTLCAGGDVRPSTHSACSGVFAKTGDVPGIYNTPGMGTSYKFSGAGACAPHLN